MDAVGNIPDIRLISRIGNDDNLLELRDASGDLGNIPKGIEGFCFVKISIH